MKLLRTETDWKTVNLSFTVNDTIWEVHCTVFLTEHIRESHDYGPPTESTVDASIEGWSAEGYVLDIQGQSRICIGEPNEATSAILQPMIERAIAEREWD